METLADKPEREIRRNEISLKEFILKIQDWVRYLASRWRFILLAGILGGLAGYLYATLRKTVYIASSTFVLDEQGSRGGLSQYAGLASMMGVDLGGGGGGIFQGDNIIELYRSGNILKKTLLSPGDFNGKQQLLLERYIAFNSLKERWDKKPELRNISFRSPPFNRLQDSILNEIVEDINENYLFVGKPDKKLNILKVEVKARDELFAKSFNELIVKNVSDYYIETRTKKSLENVTILQHQADSIRAALNRDISSVALSIDANPNINPARQVLRVPSQRRQVDAEANKAILSELVKNLEISKVNLRKETPLIQVIDNSVLPLKKDKVGKSKAIIVGAFLFMFLLSAILILRRIYFFIMK
ncbi:lipopolysaccharide biosynthesis protein [Arcticibacter sp.]|uniref:lipopolysaccharide biosynthesis protein n=1 Tax=Arcticibacter sp. TaxID=1872630 RepID=UPI00388D3BB6